MKWEPGVFPTPHLTMATQEILVSLHMPSQHGQFCQNWRAVFVGQAGLQLPLDLPIPCVCDRHTSSQKTQKNQSLALPHSVLISAVIPTQRMLSPLLLLSLHNTCCPLCPLQPPWLLSIPCQLLPLKRLRQTKVQTSFLHRPLY